jgi:hypothetical protein
VLVTKSNLHHKLLKAPEGLLSGAFLVQLIIKLVIPNNINNNKIDIARVTVRQSFGVIPLHSSQSKNFFNIT